MKNYTLLGVMYHLLRGMDLKKEKKKFLLRYRDAKIEEEIYRIEAEAILGCKLLPSTELTGMPSTHVIKDLSKMSEEIEEHYQEYMRLRYGSAKTAAKIFNAINSLQDISERRLLIERYIKFDNDFKLKKWDVIATKLDYSRSATLELHKRALKNLILD